MVTDVLFENKEEQLIITLNKNSNFETIKKKVISILDASPELFQNIKEPIIIKGKRLQDSEEKEILNLLKKKTDLKIVIERPKKLGVATIDSIFSKDLSVSNYKIFSGTIRSGQRIEYEGSILLFGDVNAGSEVVAEQNIVVLGNIRGHVHAGAKGNRSAIIAANTINPTQLRIADLIYKNEPKTEVGNNYEIAKVNLGVINIEK